MKDGAKKFGNQCTVNSRYNKLQMRAEKVCYVKGMPKAIAKDIRTSELVHYIV